MHPPYRAKIRYTLHGSPVIAYLPSWSKEINISSAWSLVAAIHRIPISGPQDIVTKAGGVGIRDVEILEVSKVI